MRTRWTFSPPPRRNRAAWRSDPHIDVSAERGRHALTPGCEEHDFHIFRIDTRRARDHSDHHVILIAGRGGKAE